MGYIFSSIFLVVVIDNTIANGILKHEPLTYTASVVEGETIDIDVFFVKANQTNPQPNYTEDLKDDIDVDIDPDESIPTDDVHNEDPEIEHTVDVTDMKM